MVWRYGEERWDYLLSSSPGNRDNVEANEALSRFITVYEWAAKYSYEHDSWQEAVRFAIQSCAQTCPVRIFQNPRITAGVNSFRKVTMIYVYPVWNCFRTYNAKSSSDWMVTFAAEYAPPNTPLLGDVYLRVLQLCALQHGAFNPSFGPTSWKGHGYGVILQAMVQ